MTKLSNTLQISDRKVWFMRQAGRYLPEYREIRSKSKNFLEMCYNPQKVLEITYQPLKRFDIDFIILFSDILVVPDAIGMNVEFIPGTGPVLESIKSINDIKINNVEKFIEKLSPVFESVKLIKSKLPKNINFIGFAGSPWTVATYMIEGGGSKNFAITKTLMNQDVENFEKIINLLTEYTIEYLSHQIDAGVDTVQLFDSWSGVLNNQMFKKYVIDPNAKIVDAISKRYPHVNIITFPRMCGLRYVDFCQHVDTDILAFDEVISREWIKNNIPDNIILQGNFDPFILFSSKDEIKKELYRIHEAFQDRRLILNLGHGILPQTNIDNVNYLIELWKNLR